MSVEEFLNKFTLLGVPCVLLIPMLVALIKSTGWVPKGWGGGLALAVSFVIFGLVALTNYFPTSMELVSYLVGATLIGLGAIGVHSTYETIKARVTGQPDGS